MTLKAVEPEIMPEERLPEVMGQGTFPAVAKALNDALVEASTRYEQAAAQLAKDVTDLARITKAASERARILKAEAKQLYDDLLPK